MAEVLGLILGEYMIPSEMPVIFITDSENARTLQRNIRNKSQHTHRAYIQRVKQGIDTALANHLEHLIAQWPREDRLNSFMWDTYERGEQICKLWATQGNNIDTSLPLDCQNYEEDNTYIEDGPIKYWKYLLRNTMSLT
jgi:hypothetical protein